MSIPQYKHDCKICTFLGTYNKYDLYYCPQCDNPTIIARYGNEGSEYVSGMTFHNYIDSLKECYKRAKEKGLI